jgi:hypothetical protein
MIIKNLTTPAGAATAVHAIRQIQIGAQGNFARVEVRSYANEQAYATDAGNLGNQVLTVPLDGSIIALIEKWLIESSDSPFAGGSTATDAADSLEALRTRKAAEMSQRCADTILGGFVSSALGEAHTYPAKPSDQANLTGSVVRSFYPNVGVDWLTPFWCADADGVWAFRMHTAAQIQHVGDDAVAARLECMGKNEQMQGLVAAAATADELAIINWPS